METETLAGCFLAVYVVGLVIDLNGLDNKTTANSIGSTNSSQM